MEKLSIKTIKTSKSILYLCTTFLGFFFLFLFLIHEGPQETLLDSFESTQPTILALSNLGKAYNNSLAPSQTPSPQPSYMPKPQVEMFFTPVLETMNSSNAPFPSLSKPLDEVGNFQMQDPNMDFFKAPTLPSPSISKPLVEVVFPIAPTPSPTNYQPFMEESSSKECNILEGKWVFDPKAYPLYHARKCPFLSPQVTCIKNGRPDSLYKHWRWQPSGCDIPRFNGTHMLEMLRGKTVALVGDSINRNMWESLVCLLYSSIPRRSRANIDAHSGIKVFRAKDYNVVVEFYMSPFVIPLDTKSFGKHNVLRLDSLPHTSRRWREADVLIFNTGHWWTHHGPFQSWDMYERDNKLVRHMERDEAFERGLMTWARWVDSNVNPKKTTVFFRSISPEHKGANWCYNQTQPILNETYTKIFPESMVGLVKRTIAEMKTPVNYLDITRLSEYRKDAHTAVYNAIRKKKLSMEERNQLQKQCDCSHWCLPGVPDTWNALLYAILFQKINKPL